MDKINLVKNVAIEWKDGKQAGIVEVSSGKIKSISIEKGKGNCNGNRYNFTSEGSCRLGIVFEDDFTDSSSFATIVSINNKDNPFSFFLRDVNSNCPIYIEAYGVIVTEIQDNRSFYDIKENILHKVLLTKIQKINSEDEENYEKAHVNTRNLKCQTWLGLSRDMRIFEFGFRGEGTEVWDWIKPKFHGSEVFIEELEKEPIRFNFMVGRGIGCIQDIKRRLEDGIYPILHAIINDEEVIYNLTAFVSLETRPLESDTLRGTHYIIADHFSPWHMFTKEQEALKDSLIEAEINREEETVLFCRIEAVNTCKVPRYAWFKCPAPNISVIPERSIHKLVHDSDSGFGIYYSGRVCYIARQDSSSLESEETAVLIQPGQKITFEFMIPHQPIPKERAVNLAKQEFDYHFEKCVEFWKNKLKNSGSISVPEKRVNEMIKAGLLHLDLVCYGLEPDRPVIPVVGIYSAIGSESSSIIQFLDSMGRHDIARRAIMYFIEKQHDDGFIQNFGGYMLETGPVLWNIGEHYRYTKDDAWIDMIKPNIKKACDYIIQWRRKNMRDDLIGKGYGMMEGKVADPEDPYHSFMLNGYGYLGLSRVAEIFEKIDPEYSYCIKNEADSLKKDIRNSFIKAMADSPVVPLGNGSWCPTVSPWVEYTGPVCLYAKGGKWYTHGNFFARDSMLGPVWLMIQEVIDPCEIYGEFLINYLSDIMHINNVAFSQPYYSCHPWANLKRGEVKAFLKEFYNGFSGLADRETYTFWEHYFHASPHKTHEESWFLMQCRWMLFMEERNTLKLLAGIPRSWMEDGNVIELDNVACYFGKIRFKAESQLNHGIVKARIELAGPNKQIPDSVVVRIPHPQNRMAVYVKGGIYNPADETVTINDFKGTAEIIAGF